MRSMLGIVLLLAACATAPEPVATVDGGTLCLDAGEVRAVFDTCGSSCAEVTVATCAFSDDASSVATAYTHVPSDGDICTADCAWVDAACTGVPDDLTGLTATLGSTSVALDALVACDSLP